MIKLKPHKPDFAGHCPIYNYNYIYVCVCCQELEDIIPQESGLFACILDHPEFATVCLFKNVPLGLVLRVALAGTVTVRGETIMLPQLAHVQEKFI